MTNQPSNPDGQPHQDDSFIPVVGIGASAGGLEAFTQLLSNLSDRSGMAYVLVQHLEPTHDSHLADILSKSTAMPVTEVTDGTALEPDHVYVIPPNANMALEQGALRLTPRGESRGAHLPIDFFLRSLAQDKRRPSIGVVLSGTGSDGTLGLAEIKAAGGITFAQDEQSAKYSGMPLSAMAEGTVDIALPPADIARELARIGSHAYLGHGSPEESGRLFSDSDGDFSRIIALLRSSSGVDFTHYRDSTLKRRILRRMALGRREALSDYVRLLESNGAELKALYQDILIHVTRFFRDPKVFEALAEVVLPLIQKAKLPDETIRVWVAGCATGEEAYSLAIAICEFQDSQSVRFPLRIFASDISESPSLEKARAGAYPENIEHDVSPERLRRFFVREASGYRINKEIREMCIFAKHDVGADPPFAKLDLISCRNVLIYLSAPLQRRIIPAFHYALNPVGFLLLGTSETIGRDTDLFSAVDPQLKIYSKKMAAARLPILHTKVNTVRAQRKAAPLRRPPNPLDFQHAADRLLLRKFVPPGVLVNKDMDVLQFRGRTSPFLEPPQGGAAFNLVKMAQESLSLELRKAIGECDRTGAPVSRKDVRILDGRMIHRVNLEVLPIRLPDAAEACFLILFEEEDPSSLPALAALRSQRDPPEEEEVALLRLELSAAKEYLQTIREQCEAINEELKSSNEEMESSNEELQSTNEELETAKEELQSANEELATMNDELRNRNVELGELNDDLTNLLGTVQIPIIMLGSDLCIRRFTPSAGKTLRLTGADMGRPIGNVRLAIPDFDFEKLVKEVISSQEPSALEIRDQDGRWHTLKIHPYRTSDGAVDGAVIVLLDIDEIKRAQHRLQESGDYARSIVDTVREPLLILDEDLRIHSANLSYYQLFGALPQDTEGKPLREVGEGLWRIPELLALLEKPSGSGDPRGFENFEVNLDLSGRRRTLMLNARRLLQSEGLKHMTLLAIEDITDRRRSERDLRLLKFFSDQSPDPYYLMDRAGKFSYVNRSSCEKLDYSEAELLALNMYRIEPDCTDEKFSALFDRVHVETVPPFETEHVTKAGRRFPVECSATGVKFEGEEFMLVVARDITERRRAAEALHESEEKLRQSQRMEAIGKLAGGVAHDFNNLLTAINGYSALCLAEVPAKGDLHDHLDEIHKAGERAAALTRQLLAYSRKQILSAKVLDLNAIVSNMHNMLNRLIGERFRLLLNLDKSLGLIKGDPGQMEQVLINLVVNARDALPNGGEIKLRTRNEQVNGRQGKTFPPVPPGSYVTLSVSDNGVGMDAEVQKRIFDPFYTTKGLGKGTGLGLSVVQGIVSQSGGYIVVESKAGEGSTFKILLPRETLKEITPPPKHEGEAPVLQGKETILLVEDEETVRNFTRKILEMHGYSVLEANNGNSALLVNEQHKDLDIHILVTDVVMPGMSGRELAERFLAARPESRVLFMSGYTEDAGLAREGVLQREAHFIQKPFSPGALAKAVRETLEFTRSLEPGKGKK